MTSAKSQNLQGFLGFFIATATKITMQTKKMTLGENQTLQGFEPLQKTKRILLEKSKKL